MVRLLACFASVGAIFIVGGVFGIDPNTPETLLVLAAWLGFSVVYDAFDAKPGVPPEPTINPERRK